MADFDYDGPDLRPEPFEPDAFRQHVPPVLIRLMGRERDVLAAFDVLRQVFATSDISRVMPGRLGQVRLYLVISRDFPYSGGPK